MQPITINNFERTDFSEFVEKSYPINLNNSEFSDTVKKIVEDYEIDEIIETGTFNGLGSTSVFAKTGKYVFTVECNKNNYEVARKNLEHYQNVCVIHGLSVDRKTLMRLLLKENFDLDTKYDSEFPKTFYMREICQDVVIDGALSILCNNNRKQLVFLDSAGGVGWIEYQKFMEGECFNKILMLDDISHIKHKRSVEDLEKNNHTVFKSSDKRFAWCDLSKGKLKK